MRATPASSPRVREPWSEYLDWFHARRPGITEEILSRSVAEGLGANPYGWLKEPLPTEGRVLDLVCGSAPLMGPSGALGWVGVDRSLAELERAGGQGCYPLVRADATSLPFRAEAFNVVVCSMALMLVRPVEAALAEVHRALAPGGQAVFLVPGSYPLSGRDRLRYARLLAALRQLTPAYPTRAHLAGLNRRLARAGFRVVSDERARFGYPVADEHDARRFVESLYTPGCPAERLEHAVRLCTPWVGSTVGVPLRRLVCVKPAGGHCIGHQWG